MKFESCSCAAPVAVERAERKGAAWTECARCLLPVPVKLVSGLAKSA
jgi:hypothetical protein